MPTSKPTSPAPSLDSDDDCMKIVVTGASGVLGQGVVELALRATRHQLILVDRKPPPAGSVLDNPRIEYVTAELKSYTSFLEVLTSKRVDALIHLAAYPNPFLAHASETHVTNVTLSFNALQAAKEAGIRQVVMASSVNAVGGVYSSEVQYDYFPLDEQHRMLPEDAYSLSKAVLEMQCDAFARACPEMTIASLRFHHCVPTKKVIAANKLPDARRDLWGYVLIESAARACLLALEVGWKGHEVMYVVSNEHAGVSSEANAEELAKKYYPGTKRKAGVLSASQGFYDCSKAERLLGWKHEGGKQPA